MGKEYFTPRQAICVLSLFIFGSNAIIGINPEVKQDVWLSILLVLIMSIPFYIIYARIMKLYPEKGLFDIFEIVFGKILGKVFTVFIIWYAIHLGALVLRNFSEFIQISSMPETPQLALMIFMTLVTIYLAKSNVNVFGKWSIIALGFVMISLLLTVLFSIKSMHFDNILPIMEQNFGVIGEGAYKYLTFPFLETVLFLCLAGSVKKQDSPYKIYFISLFISGFMLLLVVFRNIEVLGVAMLSSACFPSYIAVRIIEVGDFLTRFESSISMNLILGGITKITLCIMAASKGVASLFVIKNEKHITVPVAFLSLCLCAIIYNNAMEMFAFIEIYQYYVIPFQILIPLAVWITAEFKVKHDKKKKSAISSELQEDC